MSNEKNCTLEYLYTYFTLGTHITCPKFIYQIYMPFKKCGRNAFLADKEAKKTTQREYFIIRYYIMSRNYPQYSQYLGARKCCDIKTNGPTGPVGPTGQSAIGQKGDTGAGTTGPTGATGPGVAFGGLAAHASNNNGVWYDESNGQLYYTTAKTFVIDHPLDGSRLLVHACLEGPESGVYYRGTGHIHDNHSTIIELPHYVDALATDFTVQVTPIYDGKLHVLNASEVSRNQFVVYGDNCVFHWHVTGKRSGVIVEPLKTAVHVKGSGPYLYI